ncbi:MAG: MazG nucleotide pyrophosphohydrolase domain-containing protein [Candidatus Woykebacteria bacterium]
MKLNEAVLETKKVANSMPPPKWEIYQRFNDLVEEVGELANAIQVTEGFKTKNRSKSELVDSVCDVLFSIFLVAAHYKIDLEEEYPKVLKEIDNRRKKGEFDLV